MDKQENLDARANLIVSIAAGAFVLALFLGLLMNAASVTGNRQSSDISNPAAVMLLANARV